MKTCRDCGSRKSLEEFFKESRNADGYMHRCKSCKQAMTHAWREKNRQKWNAYMREYQAEHPKSELDRHKKRDRTHRHRYGLSLDQRQEMLLSQEGKCAICKTKLLEGRRTHLDHDHKTGKIRALLCHSCNHFLGNIKDSIDVAEALTAYLKKHS